MENPLVSVALALYNGEKYLPDQLASILGQTYANLEIIAVDDCSNDRSVEIARQFAKTDNRLKVFKNDKNLGLVQNFLRAVSLCGGTYVCFSDQDDVWRRDKIEILARLLAQNHHNKLVYSDLELTDQSAGSFWAVSKISPKRGFLGAHTLLRNLAPGCAMLFDRQVADLLGRAYSDDTLRRANSASRLDDVAFMHDQLAFAFAGLLGRIDYTPEKLVHYRQHGSNTIGAFYESAKERAHLIESLRKKTLYLRRFHVFSAKALREIRELEEFTGSLANPGAFKTLRWWRFYLSLREDAFFDKWLGLAECAFPKTYENLKRKQLHRKAGRA